MRRENNLVGGKGFREGSIGDFSGHPAAAAERLPENMSERRRRELVFRQRSEDAQGRKMSSDPAKTFPQGMKEFL
jgi:hypothetical protein